jgi:hypothetical protein
MNIHEFHIAPAELQYDPHQIILETGYPDLESAKYFVDTLDKLHLQLLPKLNIRAGFRIIEGISNGPDSFSIGQHIFNTGKIISSGLSSSTIGAIFLCTVGEGFEEFFKPLFEASPAEGYLVDLLGSMIVEATADYMEEKIRDYTVQNYEFQCTNRYSPGYCNWNVSEQSLLFDLLPLNFCGVSLSDSSLMHPRKSVSGLIGLGSSVKKHQYKCAICEAEQCFRRKG